MSPSSASSKGRARVILAVGSPIKSAFISCASSASVRIERLPILQRAKFPMRQPSQATGVEEQVNCLVSVTQGGFPQLRRSDLSIVSATQGGFPQLRRSDPVKGCNFKERSLLRNYANPETNGT